MQMQIFKASNILEISFIVLYCSKPPLCSPYTVDDLWNNVYNAAPGKSPACILDQMTDEVFELSFRSMSEH